MKRSEKQQLFSKTMAAFITWIYTLPGYGVAEGECFRPPEMQALYFKQGKSKIKTGGNHGKCLAKDLNLFIKGKYITDKEEYRLLGEKWESMHPSCRWGGRFGVKKADYDKKIGWDSSHFEWV